MISCAGPVAFFHIISIGRPLIIWLSGGGWRGNGGGGGG